MDNYLSYWPHFLNVGSIYEEGADGFLKLLWGVEEGVGAGG